jgi:hypothetical protein
LKLGFGHNEFGVDSDKSYIWRSIFAEMSQRGLTIGSFQRDKTLDTSIVDGCAALQENQDGTLSIRKADVGQAAHHIQCLSNPHTSHSHSLNSDLATDKTLNQTTSLLFRHTRINN